MPYSTDQNRCAESLARTCKRVLNKDMREQKLSHIEQYTECKEAAISLDKSQNPVNLYTTGKLQKLSILIS